MERTCPLINAFGLQYAWIGPSTPALPYPLRSEHATHCLFNVLSMQTVTSRVLEASASQVQKLVSERRPPLAPLELRALLPLAIGLLHRFGGVSAWVLFFIMHSRL